MKKMLAMIFFISASTAYASNPATKEWVLQQIAANTATLTAADWNAVCTSGTATSATGCYGNVSSTAFTKVSNSLGGFTTYANINPGNVASSVFIKSFFGGTNTPVNASSIPGTLTVQLSNSAARCGLFTQTGMGLGRPGLNTSSPSSGSSGGTAPNNVGVVSINNALTNNDIYFNSNNGTLAPVGGAPNSEPIYLVCAGYSPTDGSTATAITVTAT